MATGNSNSSSCTPFLKWLIEKHMFRCQFYYLSSHFHAFCYSKVDLLPPHSYFLSFSFIFLFFSSYGTYSKINYKMSTEISTFANKYFLRKICVFLKLLINWNGHSQVICGSKGLHFNWIAIERVSQRRWQLDRQNDLSAATWSMVSRYNVLHHIVVVAAILRRFHFDRNSISIDFYLYFNLLHFAKWAK